MATVVQFGAGAIGRGFLAQFWTEAGFEIVFVDVDAALVESLNAARAYPLSLVTNNSVETIMVAPVRALPTSDTDAVLKELASCAFAAVAIGPHVVDTVERFFAPLLRSGLRSTPLNVIVAENDPQAAATLTDLLRLSSPNANPESETQTGVNFVQAIIGRMVPRPVTENGNLAVVAEPFKDLPLEYGRWQGAFPAIPHLYEQPAFDRYVQKKLYVVNAGHAVLAYHGYLKGHEYIWQCAEDRDLITELHGFWEEVNIILANPSLTRATLLSYEEELIERFRNRVLGDAVTRVGRDPIRKLHWSDRLVWPAMQYRQMTGDLPTHILRAIAAALHFDFPGDPVAVDLRERVRRDGVAKAFLDISHYPTDDPAGLVPRIEEAYNALKPKDATVPYPAMR